MKKISFLILLLLTWPVKAELPVIDYSAMFFQGLVNPMVRKVTTLPATCTVVGSTTSSSAVLYQGRIYQCTSTNTWTFASGQSAALTSGRVPYVTTGGALTDAATLTFSSNVLQADGGFRSIGTTGTQYWLDATPTLAARVILGASGQALFSTYNGSAWRNAITITNGATDGLLTVNTDVTLTSANLVMATAGKTLQLKTGSNACSGSSTLSSGTVTVSTTCTGTTWGTDFIILLTPRGSSTGVLRVSTHIAATSFVITSTDAASSDLVGWMIIKQN